MHAFPPHEALSFFTGLELSQAVLDPYALTFVFTDMRTRLVVESKLEYVETDGKVHVYDFRSDLALIAFHPLIRAQDKIVSVDVSDWRLGLTFASSRKIIVHSDNGPYECGQIYRGDQLIVF
jgi:hypothetical protein